MSKILETTRYVVDRSQHVKINQDKVIEFCAAFQHGNLSHWLNGSPIAYSHLADSEKLNFLLVFNSTSFCYWGDPKWTIEYKGQQYDGSWGMIAAIMRAIDEGMPILDAKYRSQMSKENYQRMTRGNVEIPLLEERWKITTGLASTLVNKFEADFANIVRAANKDGLQLLNLIIENFPSFNDTSEYDDKTIYFYKRAQLLVEDVYQTFGGEGYGELNNLEGFTACADYKLPQSLRRLGILSYDAGLADKVDSLAQIPHGSAEEVEIRANTIWAVEAIKNELAKSGKIASSVGINDHLWLMGQTKRPDDKPYHRTLTTAY
ncbi:MAG: queuosine salvage family protein [Patescibacteria group bacterium]|nr:queuosine salvage family protein [Patescibacteria group bacterium]